MSYLLRFMSYLLRVRSQLLWVVTLCLSLPYVMSAQEYRGVLFGHVTDATGAVIPHASVTAVGPQQTFKTTTSGNGEFTIPFIQPGKYSITATAKGFNQVTKDQVNVDVSAKLTVDFSLLAGGTESVTVTADQSVALNTSDGSGGTVMDPEKVQSLPLNGRQIYQLLPLTPGVKITTQQYGPTGNSGTRAWDQSNATSINGQSGNYNQFSLNGAPVSQQGGGGAGTWNVAPSVDAVEEFKVMTNTYDAQYGRTGGGTVNTILKSGTNAFHGTVFDFWRNSLFDANYYQYKQQEQAKPFHNQHQFGGTIGGPVWKDKTFFFFSYEGWREVLPVTRTVTVPTADMRPGNGDVNLTSYQNAVGLGNIYDPSNVTCTTPSTSGCDQYQRAQFSNNTIPAGRITPIAAKILNVFPLPNRPGYINNYVAQDPGRYGYSQPIARIDHVFSDKTRMYAVFTYFTGSEYRNSSALPGAAAQGDIDNHRLTYAPVVDFTHTFGPRLFLDVRASYNRSYNVDPNGSVAAGSAKLTAGDLGLNMPSIPTTSKDLAPEIDMDDCCIANIIGNSISPSLYETYDLSPSVSQTIGRHNLHYGADLMLFHDVPGGVGKPNGVFTFGPGFTQQDPYVGNSDGSAMADLLLGYPESGSVDYFLTNYESYNSYAGYVQDDWKILPKLTLNLGIRYEQETSPEDRNYRLNAGFCYTCTNPVSNSLTASPMLPNGQTFTGPVLGGPQFSSSSLSPYANYVGSFLPKVGFAYLIAPNLVMRGGWGTSTALGIELGAQSSWQQSTNYTTSLDGSVTPSNYFRSGTPFSNGVVAPDGASLGLLAGIGNSLEFDRRERKIPRVQQYSFGFQGQLPQQFVLDIEYVGSHGSRLRSGQYLDQLSLADWNAGHANPSYLNQQVANPYYGAIPTSTTIGSSPTISAKNLMSPYSQYEYVYDYANPQGYNYYNSLITKLERRVGGTNPLLKSLSVLSSFTWSKAMIATGRLNNNNKGLVDAQPYYALSSADRSWVFTLGGLYGLPIGRGSLLLPNANRLVQGAVGGWQLSFIFTNQSGTPVTYPNNALYNCGTFDIANSPHTYKSYLNNAAQTSTAGGGSCFQSFPQYTTITQLPITAAVRAPWAQQTALGVQKAFTITERVKFQFKAEMFNATNTPQFPGPTTSGTTGRVTRVDSVADPNQPGAWSGYGTIGSTQLNFPRQTQFSGKILF
ncbi:TonB-dependent receptor plug [Terriglobus saanensis SP1PR4]|uniref:TonB-dependent receptor plug n=1 Tax=Terriglobus saanensis (strain ATCC BAA-1853 / DSM 23119 / SP1PR4) TaxID=401053 RepID=E8V397_TERSS|nr:TonB-dependent receptor plug [Terriglobus saanensis SP1PR4]